MADINIAALIRWLVNEFGYEHEPTKADYILAGPSKGDSE